MNNETIDRINELYRKSQAEGLTEEEKKEQDLLRKAFIAAVRGNLRSQLNNIDIINEDGSIENLGDKYGKRKGQDQVHPAHERKAEAEADQVG